MANNDPKTTLIFEESPLLADQKSLLIAPKIGNNSTLTRADSNKNKIH